MREQALFYVVFLVQILLVSGYLPSRLLARARGVLESYPPAAYPRLYVATPEAMDLTLRLYRILNYGAIAVGLALMLLDMRAGGALFSWNGGTLVMLFMLVQYGPMMACVTRPSFPYFSLKRQPDTRSSRTADLRPRRLFDFVSPMLVGIAVLLYLAFAVLVFLVERFQYPWFGGYGNLLGVTLIYLVFAAVIHWQIYGKKRDPWMAYEDRLRHIGRSVTIAVLSAIVWTSFISATILLRTLELSDLIPAVLSIVAQLAAVVASREFRLEETDFEVYREQSATT